MRPFLIVYALAMAVEDVQVIDGHSELAVVFFFGRPAKEACCRSASFCYQSGALNVTFRALETQLHLDIMLQSPSLVYSLYVHK